jgi:SAM-dependent methyltransferase
MKPVKRGRKSRQRRAHNKKAKDSQEQQLIEQVETELLAKLEVRMKTLEEVDLEVNNILARLQGESYSRQLTKLLFRRWARDGLYDEHMKATGHDLAVDHLVQQLVEIDRLHTSNGYKPIIGPRVLDMAGGTGTILKLLFDKLEQSEMAGLSVTLNDLSADMKKIARRKLRGSQPSVLYTGHDIRRMPFPDETFDVAIMSQVLHLLTDPKALKMERHPDYIMTVGNTHIQAKIEVIRRTFEMLRWNGHFVLIDEWPATFTRNIENPVQLLISTLFGKTFRPVGPKDLRDGIMKNIPFARFVAELKIPIDAYHQMYMHLYRKDPDKAAPVRRRLRSAKLKPQAENMVVQAFQRTDGVFRDRYSINHLKPNNGSKPWVDLLPMDLTGQVFDTRTDGELPERKRHFNGIILSGLLHGHTPGERFRLMARAQDAIKTGGWLLVLDEWPMNNQNSLPKHQFRDTFMKNFNVIFEGALRAHVQEGYDNGVYGYLFRKIR